jgi:hypothetical protein
MPIATAGRISRRETQVCDGEIAAHHRHCEEPPISGLPEIGNY